MSLILLSFSDFISVKSVVGTEQTLAAEMDSLSFWGKRAERAVHSM